MTIDDTFRGVAADSLNDVFCKLPFLAQGQVLMGMLGWIADSSVRLEHRVDRLGTAVDGLTEAVDDLTADVRKLVR